MRAAKSGKGAAHPPRLVAVIASAADLQRAARLRRADLLELRLDALRAALPQVEAAIATLATPLIVTARNPTEGGVNNVSASERRALLRRFLPAAAYIDIELRSIGTMDVVLHAAAEANVKRIVSVHDFRRTPRLLELERLATRARTASADIFKLVTRVDCPGDLTRLLEAFEVLKTRIPLSAMAVGRLGREARRELIARGSLLNYAHLGTAQVEGQLSFDETRRVMRAR
jgi:3-dehydroquinate dehydratase I